jgi:stage II sporulation protein AA (anti-sigma F factor antagonist)
LLKKNPETCWSSSCAVASTRPRRETFLLKKIDAGDRLLVLDLAGLEYISSIGLRVFMMAAKRVRVVDGKVVVCALQPAIQEVFTIAGFSALFTPFETRSVAAASLTSS